MSTSTGYEPKRFALEEDNNVNRIMQNFPGSSSRTDVPNSGIPNPSVTSAGGNSQQIVPQDDDLSADLSMLSIHDFITGDENHLVGTSDEIQHASLLQQFTDRKATRPKNGNDGDSKEQLLRQEVEQLRSTLLRTEDQANKFIRSVREETAQKAKAALRFQTEAYEKHASEFSEKARDICQLEVAQKSAAIEAEAYSALNARDAALLEQQASVNDLRTNLNRAQETANAEAAQKAALILEAQMALKLQGENLLQQEAGRAKTKINRRGSN